MDERENRKDMKLAPSPTLSLERGMFFGAIQGMLNDLPANKRKLWLERLSDLQKRNLLPTMNWCDDE